MFYSKEKMK